jgi:hypothetical protein
MTKWYIYGTVYFTTNQRRTSAGRRLDGYVTNNGWVAEAWFELGPTWPAGRADVTGTADNGSTVPGLRFCYYTLEEAQARAAMADITQNWARYEDTNSTWGYEAVTVP